MSYDQALAARIREQLADLSPIEEKEMMGGLVFMYNDKMCVGIFKDALMCRVAPAAFEEAVELPYCRAMEMAGRTMKGWILVDEPAIKSPQELAPWIGLALAFNKDAKASKKKRSENYLPAKRMNAKE